MDGDGDDDNDDKVSNFYICTLQYMERNPEQWEMERIYFYCQKQTCNLQHLFIKK